MKNKLKLTSILFRNCLLIFLLLEIGLGVFYNYHDENGIDSNTKKLIASGAFGDLNDETIKEIYRELRQQDMLWEPYLHYRFKPMNGKHNTIDENGIRKTLNLSLKDSTSAIKIFCFGGSTMYSAGARDAYTIPSELSKLIHKAFPNKNVEITNFGCHGYTRATENIQLQRELIKNNVPDIVIFYDGVNEVISAHQNNEAGLPTNAYNRKKEFKIAHNYKKRIELMITSSNLYRFITTLQRKISSNSPYKQLGQRSDSLATDIADTYLGYVKISKSLENTYRFKVFNFLQPVIYSKKNLTTAEKGYYKDQQYYENLYNLSYEVIRKDSLMSNDSTFVDISNVFDTSKKTIYCDFCHTSERGNQLVAERIFKYIKPVIRKRIIPVLLILI
ncbi:SGNH/GDSL hydrolase family protein [Lacinutrix neustonica]|uniref:SGNH/GDSL hydrolase family protein n=1 Tax=Lacinutrix neustonica TaxID=2980107 RepID=A0A9E8SFH3_9FLAO|nr:SGNH/GDSL hydrolase family protein [Lacinutrix neustonica]WAC03797.1 SGNH/GDSL hydrolase family protein [Lacinutrix neustonica]